VKTSHPSVPFSLKDRVVLVTGGAGDIGSAAAAQAARLGATVIIADNGTSVDGVGQNKESVTEVAERVAAENGSVAGYFCDVTDEDQVESMFDDLFKEYGNVDAVLAAAGTLRVHPVWETSLDDWREVLDSHATHTFLVSAAACRRWRGNSVERDATSGSLVTFAAATGLVGRPDLGVTHAAAKGAIAAMTLELAHEMYPYAVAVNSVCAANVQGRMADHVGGCANPGTKESHINSPQHAGMLATYLASEDAAWITGQVFRVIGGLIGRYRPWELTDSIEQPGLWTVEEVRLGLRRLYGAYPEYKALQGPHREF
jgi:NAD(P)-dependent dehydrogenase (short-subunit alcohol dehydrogenase family)